MAGPWEEFSQTEGSGPWSEFSQPEAKKEEPGFTSAIKRTAGQMASAAGLTAEDVVGKNDVTQSIRDWGKEVQEANPAGIQAAGDVIDRPGQWAKESSGSMLAQMGPQIAGGLTGRAIGAGVGLLGGPVGVAAGQEIGGRIGQAVPTFIQEYGGMREQQQREGKNGLSDKLLAAGAAVPATAIEFAFGPQRLLGSMLEGALPEAYKQAAKGSGKEIAKFIAKEGVKQGVGEASEEIPQGLLEAMGGKGWNNGDVFNPLTSTDAWKDAGFGALMALPGGALLGGGMSGVNLMRAAKQNSIEAKAPQPDKPMTQEEAAADLTASNTELAGATAAYDALPSDVPQIGYNGKPDAIIVPNQSGGTTEINRNDGALSAAVVDTGITGQMLDNGTTLVPFASRDAAQAAIDQREDADRLTVVPHPRVSGRFAMVPKDRLTLEAQDQAAMRRQQLEQEDGNAPQLDEAGSQGRGSVAGGSGGNASSVSGIGAGSGDAAASSVHGRGTSMAMGAADATESALALESAQSELAPQSAQPVSSMPGVQARNAERIAAARIAAEARGTALVDEEAAAANTSPSEAQIAAGNYKKGHIKVGPLDISVENPIGSTRSGKEGKKSWTTTMRAHYGYIKRTVGADGDQVDVFVKEGTPADHSGTVYVIDQFNPKTGRFDEHKGMVGYSSQADAARAYDDHFGDKSGPKRRKAVIGMPAATFARWAKEGDTTSPISQSGRTADEAQAEIEKSTGKLSPSRQKAAGRDPYAVAQEANDRRSGRTAGMPEQAPDNAAVARTIGATDFEEVKDEALPDANDTDAQGVLSRQAASSLRMLAKLFGKKIVIFKTDADADGFYINGNTIYIKSDSSVSQLRVLGHEMTHALRRQAPKVYQQMLDAVSELLTDAELKAFYADYNNGKTMPAEMSAEQRDALVEEWMADLGGNRWGESEFWSSMFAKLEEQHGTTLAKKIINQLRMAVVKVINSLLRTIRGGTMFAVDRRMEDNLEKIREAMAQGFADYAKAVKDGRTVEQAEEGGVKFARKAAPKLTKKELKEIANREATRIFEGKTVEQSNPLDDEQWQEVRRIALQKLKPMQRAAALKAEREYLELQKEADILSEKYKERAAEVLDMVKENGSSSVSIMDGTTPATVEGSGKLVRGKPKVLTIDVGRFFLGRQKKIDITTEAGRRAAGIALAREAAYALTQDGHAVGWYDRKVREALAISALVNPELLTSKKAQVVFKMIAAITSNGQAVRDNFILANIAYSNFKNGVPLDNVLGEGGGARRGAMNKSLVKLREMIERYGAEKVGEHLIKPLTVKEIQNQFGLKVSGEHMTTVLPAAVGLGGPKIGSFYANLSGHFDSLTMDMWFMRTVGRITGNIVVMPKTVGANLNELASILPESGELNGVNVKTLRAEIDAYNKLDEDEQSDVETVTETVPETIMYARAQLQKFSAPDANGKTFTKKTLQNENARRIVSALDSTNDSPGNGAERNNLRGVVDVARSLLAKSGIDLNVADMQAVLWYYEKNLFTNLGANNASAKPWDYASAARFGIGRALGLVDVKSSKRAGQVGPGESERADQLVGDGQGNGEAGQVKKSPSRVIFEVAPDPNDARLASAWGTLSSADKQDISKSVAAKLIPKILSHFGAAGKVVEQVGGYMGESNPSFSILLESGDPDAIANASGFILSQEQMIAVSDKPFRGGSKTGAVTIEIGNDDPADIYSQIYAKVKEAQGHTTANGQMIIINNPDLGISTQELGQKVDEALGGRYDAFGDDGIYAEFPETKDYGYDIQDAQGAAAGSPDSQWAGGLRSEANRQLEAELRLRGVKLSPARYGQPAANGGVAGQGRPGDRQLGRVDVTGTHYSREQRKHLTGGYFGTGLAGEEGKRLKEAKDTRLHSRLYAYVNEGQGVFPEAGVGAYAHTVKLDNLYDIKADPLGIRQKTRDANDRESLILDAGFDGYYAPGVFGRQGVAILMGGAATRGVTPTDTVAPAVNAETAPKTERRTDLPLGKMTGAEWKRLEPRATDLEDGKMYYRDDIKFSPAREQTKTPEFKAWFGEWDHPKAFTSKFPADLTPPSMAMDWEENKPLVLFHATNNDFNEFEAGRKSITSTTFGPVETRRHAIFTTPDNKFAESYLKKGGGQNVMPVYMDIKSPMDLRNNGAWNYADELVKNGFDNYRWPNRSDTEMWEMFDDELGEAFVAAAKKAGYDGAIMFEVDDNDKMVEVYVAFDPTQIKSATGNNGDFSPANPDIRYSPPRWYFSPLEKAFESAPDKVFGQAAQVKLWLAGNKSKLGLKDDEIFWTGINDYLDLMGKQKVSKADVLGYLAGNGVQVEEVMKGVQGYDENNPQLPVGADLYVDYRDNGGFEVTDRRGTVLGIGKTEDAAISDAYSGNPEYWEGAEATKFGQYTLPGGESYRELLLTLPPKGAPIAQRPSDGLRKPEQIYADPTYRSSHWEEPNIIAHIRMNDRTDADGKKVLFIEEVQSDWGQEGKKKGFVSDGKLPAGWSVEEVKISQYATRWAVFDNSKTQVGTYAETKEEAIKSATTRNGFTGGTPSAPFVTDTKAWLGLAVKRIMSYAAANGYDKVAFINGDQSADRYSLAKQVGGVYYTKDGVGSGTLVAMPIGKTINDAAKPVLEQDDVSEDKIEDYVGKEVAKKLLESTPDEQGFYFVDGEDLKIGGEGMKTFYDRIVPQVVSDQLKKVGGKMEVVNFGSSFEEYVSSRGMKYENGKVFNKYGQEINANTLKAQYRDDYKEGSPTKQFGFPVTPKMSEPLPLFSPKRSGPDVFDKAERELLKKHKAGQLKQNEWIAGMTDATDRFINEVADRFGDREMALNIFSQMGIVPGNEYSFVNLRQHKLDWKTAIEAGPEVQNFKVMLDSFASSVSMDDAVKYIKGQPYPPQTVQTAKDFLVSIAETMRYAVNKKVVSNPKPSGLLASFSPRRAQTETPEFKAWFGDSKVVDADGRPLVVYRGGGTEYDDALIAKRFGAHFGTVGQANKVAGSGAYGDIRDEYDGRTPSVTPAYIRLENPWMYSGDVDNWNYIEDLKLAIANSFDDGTFPLTSEQWADGVQKHGTVESPFIKRRYVSTPEQVRKILEDYRVDGVIYDNNKEGVGKSYIVFNPTQVKSSIGNNGQFDPTNPDIRRSNARSAATGQPIVASWASPEISSFDNIVRQLQDKLIDTKRVVQAISGAGKAISDAIDPYLQEILYHGRAAKKTQDFAEQELRPLLQSMQVRKVSMQEIEDFLWAQHAPERNAQNAKAGIQDGSGLTDGESRDILAGRAVTKNGRTIQLDSAKMQSYRELAKRFKEINDKTLDELVSYGLETRDTVNQWKRTYQNYVPLMRDMSDDNYAGANNRGLGTGKGFSIRGSASKRAIGSQRGVIDIVANIAMQRERAITRGEKNKVSQATYGLALAAPNPGFWLPIDPAANRNPVAIAKLQQDLINLGMNPIDAQNVAQEPVQTYIDPNTGKASTRINPALRNRNDVLAVRVNGEDKFLMFSSNDRAQAMVANLKNLGDDQLGGFLQASAKVTRWFAAVNTQYNPVFGMVNGLRDFSSAMLNLTSTPLAGQQGRVAAYGIAALRGIYADLRDRRAGRKPSSNWEQEFEEFARNGGQTGYRDMFNTAEDRTKALQNELQVLASGKGKKLVSINENNPVFAWLSDYNTAIENAFRLAAYKVAKENGITPARAAQLAKNLTVNFNKKGLAATQTGALYAFFNAAVQGTARIGETLLQHNGNPSDYKNIRLSSMGKKIVLGGITLGVMQALLGAMAGWDDDEPKQFQRERNLIIPIPGSDKYISIPMPLGFHVLPNIGRITTEFVLGGFKNPGKKLTDLLGVMAEAFNPIGNAGMSLQTIAPTFADPLVALATNKDWNGQSIAREDFNRNNPTPGWTRTKDTATPWAKALAYGLNYISGGGEYGKGLISPSPDQIDYLVGQVTGGVGREAGKVAQTVSATAKGEELPKYKIPVVGRFIGETTGVGPESGKYYSNLERIGAHKDPIKRMREDGKNKEVMAYYRDNPEARLIVVADSTQRDISELKTIKRKLEKKGESQDRINVVNEQIKAKMRTFNNHVQKLEKQAD